jgi:HK97 family phage prohead protease
LSEPIYNRAGSAFREKVARGAFDNALRNGEVFSLVEHDPDRPLGRTSAGSLELCCDGTGLAARTFPDLSVSYAKDLYQNVKNGTIRSMSFAFTMPEDGSGEDWDSWDDGEDGDARCTRLRTLRRCESLSDVSYVLRPAYKSSEANIRSFFPQGIPGGVVVSGALSRVELRGYVMRDGVFVAPTNQADIDSEQRRTVLVKSQKFML